MSTLQFWRSKTMHHLCPFYKISRKIHQNADLRPCDDHDEPLFFGVIIVFSITIFTKKRKLKKNKKKKKFLGASPTEQFWSSTFEQKMNKYNKKIEKRRKTAWSTGHIHQGPISVGDSDMLSKWGRQTAARPRRRSLCVESFSESISLKYWSEISRLTFAIAIEAVVAAAVAVAVESLLWWWRPRRRWSELVLIMSLVPVSLILFLEDEDFCRAFFSDADEEGGRGMRK